MTVLNILYFVLMLIIANTDDLIQTACCYVLIIILVVYKNSCVFVWYLFCFYCNMYVIMPDFPQNCALRKNCGISSDFQ